MEYEIAILLFLGWFYIPLNSAKARVDMKIAMLRATLSVMYSTMSFRGMLRFSSSYVLMSMIDCLSILYGSG